VQQSAPRPVTPNQQTSQDHDEPPLVEAAAPIMPPMLRAKTQPEFPTWPDPDTPVKVSSSPDAMLQIPLPNFTSRIPGAPSTLLVDRMGLSAMRTGKGHLQSMIPRAVKKQESKVSALAKHFEEMSREFEKERLRERRQRAARNRISRAYPMTASQPIVEVFRDANEAVEERDVPEGHYRRTSVDGDIHEADLNDEDPFTARDIKDHSTEQEEVEDTKNEASRLSIALPSKALEDDQIVESESSSEDEEDEDQPSITSPRRSTDFSDKGAPSIFDIQQDYTIELPKHEKTSLLKMLTSFWSERSASGWSPLEYPMASTDHIFADSDIIVREDEPSSLIAFALASSDYEMKLQRFRERAMTVDLVHAQQPGPSNEFPKTQEDINVERIMLGKTATHMKYQFQAGTARMLVKVFYAESFDAIRAKCGISHRFVESLSRSIKFDSKGGKTKSLFLKTLDERFILKSLSAIETQSFLKFAPDYFDYMSKCLFHNLPSALAKMLGFYQVVIKNPATGTDLNYFLQVMENVFYEGPQPSHMFDLKGSMRNRRVQATGEADEVLLDENLLDYISAHPIYVRAHSNSLLVSSIQNDTLFCSKQNVMDYSLIAGLYDTAEKQELCVGIIDYIRTYTWDKKIESWIKDRGKHKPTVMSPKDYRARFRRSMPTYFPMVPGPWQNFGREVLGREEIRGEETVEEEDEPIEEGVLERESSEM
jgi:1-phosphatidylinositol-3-phosphate 5-kinase